MSDLFGPRDEEKIFVTITPLGTLRETRRAKPL